MILPLFLERILQDISLSGKSYLVGGCVRDFLLGIPVGDFDVEVYGMHFDALHNILQKHGRVDVVGKAFGVLKIQDGSHMYDFALARTENRFGVGHADFRVQTEVDITPEVACRRRDFTVNALLWDWKNKILLDFVGGKRDLDAKILRHVGPQFGEDPLRVLRAFQFIGRFGWDIAPETLKECQKMAQGDLHLSPERIAGEWKKWETLSLFPGKALTFLRESTWMTHTPELAALIGISQDPEWHPEGDVWQHTLCCVDALVHKTDFRTCSFEQREILLLAVLCHDFGKVSTTVWAKKEGKMRWRSPNHAQVGVPLAKKFLERIGTPTQKIEKILRLGAEHMAPFSGNEPLTESAVRRLSARLFPATLSELIFVLLADHHGRPPLSSSAALARIAELQKLAEHLQITMKKPQPILTGALLLEQGMQPGPALGAFLKKSYEAQLDGAFADVTGALEWLKRDAK